MYQAYDPKTTQLVSNQFLAINQLHQTPNPTAMLEETLPWDVCVLKLFELGLIDEEVFYFLYSTKGSALSLLSNFELKLPPKGHQLLTFSGECRNFSSSAAYSSPNLHAAANSSMPILFDVLASQWYIPPTIIEEYPNLLLPPPPSSPPPLPTPPVLRAFSGSSPSASPTNYTQQAIEILKNYACDVAARPRAASNPSAPVTVASPVVVPERIAHLLKEWLRHLLIQASIINLEENLEKRIVDIWEFKQSQKQSLQKLIEEETNQFFSLPLSLDPSYQFYFKLPRAAHFFPFDNYQKIKNTARQTGGFYLSGFQEIWKQLVSSNSPRENHLPNGLPIMLNGISFILTPDNTAQFFHLLTSHEHDSPMLFQTFVALLHPHGFLKYESDIEKVMCKHPDRKNYKPHILTTASSGLRIWVKKEAHKKIVLMSKLTYIDGFLTADPTPSPQHDLPQSMIRLPSLVCFQTSWQLTWDAIEQSITYELPICVPLRDSQFIPEIPSAFYWLMDNCREFAKQFNRYSKIETFALWEAKSAAPAAAAKPSFLS